MKKYPNMTYLPKKTIKLEVYKYLTMKPKTKIENSKFIKTFY